MPSREELQAMDASVDLYCINDLFIAGGWFMLYVLHGQLSYSIIFLFFD